MSNTGVKVCCVIKPLFLKKHFFNSLFQCKITKHKLSKPEQCMKFINIICKDMEASEKKQVLKV